MDDDSPVTLKEFFNICRRGKKTLIYGTFLFIIIGTLFSLTRPVLYKAEATFLDKGMKGDEQQASLSTLLTQGKSGKKSEAIPLFESRTLMEKLVRENGLQAALESPSYPKEIALRIWKNLLTTYATLLSKEFPVILESSPTITFSDVYYPRHVPLHLQIALNHETYQVSSSSGQKIGSGQLGAPFRFEEISFRVHSQEQHPQGTYTLKLSPLATTAKKQLNHLKVKADKELSSIIYLTYLFPYREEAAGLLNGLMLQYSLYLKEHHQTLVDDQLAYLQKRQGEMGRDLKKMMQDHANALSSEYSSVGFPDAEKAMNFLASSMQDCKQQLLKAKLEMHHFSPQAEMTGSGCQGIDVATAKDLSIAYHQELGGVEASIAQYEYMLKQLKNPLFEISSLSSTLSDSVSGETIKKASELELSLYDEANRMPKEQERIKFELNVQKRFLTLHLEQTLQLLTLKQEVLQNKLVALQQVLRSLTQDEIAILENHQRDLQLEIAELPKKWVSEKLLNQQMQINQHMVDELTKLTDSKNIARNLEVVQSTPIDIAVPPLHPKDPHLLLFMFASAVLGGSLTLFYLLTRSLSKS